MKNAGFNRNKLPATSPNWKQTNAAITELIRNAIIAILMHLKTPIPCILNKFLAALPD